MKYAIYGYYGGNNFGDEAILKAIINLVEINDNNASIKIISHNPSNTRKSHNHEVVKATIFNKEFLKKNFVQYKKTLKDIDVIIIGGGQLLQDSLNWKAIGQHSLLCFYGLLAKKKVIYFGIGAGPINENFSKMLTKTIIKLSTGIVTRDKASTKLLNTISNNKDNIKTGNDLAFNEFPIKKNKKNSKNIIALSLRKYNFPLKKVNEMKKILQELNNMGKTVFINTEKDHIFFARYFNSNKTKIILPETLDDYYSILNDTKIMVSMRFHFVVYCYINNIPCVALNYDPKIKAFCKKYNIPMMEMQEISKNNFLKYLEKAKLKIYSNQQTEKNKSQNLKNLSKLLKSKKKNIKLQNKLQLYFLIILIHCKVYLDLLIRQFKKISLLNS